MKSRLTGIEIVGLFNIEPKDLPMLRKEGLPCEFFSGKYWYDYDKVVEFLS